MICVLLFGISSALCGTGALSLPLLILFRILARRGRRRAGAERTGRSWRIRLSPKTGRQGFLRHLWHCGGLRAGYRTYRLGGYITDNFDWRWIFFTATYRWRSSSASF